MKIQNAIFFLLMLQASCSPIYGIKKEYKGPENESGKACVVKCAYVRNDCYRQCQVDMTNCQLTEKMINAQERSQPLVSIINSNGNKQNNNLKNNNGHPCKSENIKCKESCSSDIMCKTQCDMYMDMCNAQQNFNGHDKYDNFVSSIDKKSANITVRKQNSISLCSSNKCDRLCTNNYDLCFSSCGGQIITYKQCVAFCDKNK
ncbi:hypothetical protein ECHHL_0297 [Ehrlichia chaffeensis str. Heartland]|uniref:Uncharacterized protein n=1 Tax=Ehrlichia chaffeensis (strain ATCC CRL-10679 / Arkansas) TaxID=205920 RepID=Q2GHB5_EHRCR|nr:hypothetical protein [Ehrlichia chaffeensis]ABD45244.1 conserved hypothetical protein [Ehrlichia chaffeensis str. Arkansas]AHX03462.1 hypothetical protein ECHHL_0297 [Ehrlichia chaffeensis str. Heartland]AHX05818.1 hypothetical protein ECHJAX_0761 [Ehrlichia chaffeensis str. Jax]AHX06810.1 hypothetical protein ECHLIB_0765 [Ehrlichia chaffeensis str. Liberty]AHX07685.1 hypothetical protein ECHOSC_0306 [Ehrlichia chaffeensis str. Osceola]